MSNARRIWSKTIDFTDGDVVRSARAELRSFLREDAPNIDIDAATIILGELLANAFQHGKAPVRIDLLQHEDALSMRVADAGTGITRPRDKAAAGDTHGRGFEIIERLGGGIDIAPQPFSCVTVALPSAQACVGVQRRRVPPYQRP